MKPCQSALTKETIDFAAKRTAREYAGEIVSSLCSPVENYSDLKDFNLKRRLDYERNFRAVRNFN